MSSRFTPRAKVPVGPYPARAPRKGMFSQGVAILLDRAPSLAELGTKLAGFDVIRETAGATGDDGWVFGGPSLMLGYRREVNGLVQVDVVDRPWPDAMGEPQGAGAMLFGAWGMGHFGPCTFPGALERAVQHAYRFRDATSLVPRHRAFIRIRSSYVFGASDDSPIAPVDYDALDELRFVTEVQRALTQVGGCLAAFNPNGELVLSGEQLDAALARDAAGRGLAVDAWANVRMFRHTDDTGAWTLFDTDGMEQLDVGDHEAVLPSEHASFDHVPGLLYTMAAYDAERRGVLSGGDTATDSGGVAWTATGRDEAIVTPPRDALRWMPDGMVAPAALSARSR